ncbi:MAG: uncharacterized membrane protein YraQ (UPF0718 family) [Phycisphaerales bacterium]|jgi:uncharacterized membrane protein YraQ (UPF0718 family)
MVDFLQSWLQAFWFILLESGVWLIFGFALAGAVHALVPAGLVERQLSGKGLKPIVKASLLGIPLPLCSCSVIPVAAGLRRSGASRGASAAFAISTPQTGEESIPLTWALFGPVFALSRPVVAVATALVAGLAIEKAGGEHEAAGEGPKSCCGEKTGETPVPQEKKSTCCSSEAAAPAKPCCSAEPEPVKACCSDGSAAPPHETRESWSSRLRRAARHGFITMPVDLAPWLMVGLVLAGLVSAAVPEDWISQNVGSGIVPMLAMLVVGIPLYICATSSTPLAFSLVAAGLSPGAALVLLLAGPATNVATISWSLKDLGLRATVIYVITIAVMSLACGLAFDAFFSGMISLASEAMIHERSENGLFRGGAVSLLLLLITALSVRAVRAFGPMVSARPTHG